LRLAPPGFRRPVEALVSLVSGGGVGVTVGIVLCVVGSLPRPAGAGKLYTHPIEMATKCKYMSKSFQVLGGQLTDTGGALYKVTWLAETWLAYF